MADEHNAGHADTLTQLQLLLKERCKVRGVSSSAGPSQEGLRSAKLNSTLGAEELELQTLPGLASKKTT